MKKSVSIFILFAITLIYSSCEQDKISDPLNLKGIEMNLSINLTKGEFEIEDGLDILSKEFTNYIFSDNIESSERIFEFFIQKRKDKLLINHSSETEKIAEPCETQSKKCYSKTCVEDTIKDILGDGSRSVNIKYIRNSLSVTIEYTYLDC